MWNVVKGNIFLKFEFGLNNHLVNISLIVICLNPSCSQFNNTEHLEIGEINFVLH